MGHPAPASRHSATGRMARASDGRGECSLWLASVPGSAESRRGQCGRRQRHPDIGLQLFTVSPGGILCGQCLRYRRPKGPFPRSSGQVFWIRAPPHPLLKQTFASDRTGHSRICEVGVRRESELGGDRWRTSVVAGFAAGVDEQLPGLASVSEVRYGCSEMERLCPASAVRGGLLISKPYPCRLVLCGLSDTLGLLDCVMLP